VSGSKPTTENDLTRWQVPSIRRSWCVAGSAAVTGINGPPISDGPVVVETLAVGVCGTDLEICHGSYGDAPAGSDRLVIGHESLGRILEAQAGNRLAGVLGNTGPDAIHLPHRRFLSAADVGGDRVSVLVEPDPLDHRCHQRPDLRLARSRPFPAGSSSARV